jgi:hypothetical protein
MIMQYVDTRHTSPVLVERQRLWAAGRELLRADRSRAERVEGARMVIQALALPPGVELDESLCRRAGIPLDLLRELRDSALAHAA